MGSPELGSEWSPFGKNKPGKRGMNLNQPGFGNLWLAALQHIISIHAELLLNMVCLLSNNEFPWDVRWVSHGRVGIIQAVCTT